MREKTVILVVGLSGAGKSVTMSYLESVGYYCVDNLPIKTLESVIVSLDEDDEFYDFAISINPKASEYELVKVLKDVKKSESIKIKVLYLDASDDVILRRFQFTRKRHPFTNINVPLADALKSERHLLSNIKRMADAFIDTSELDEDSLKKKIKDIFNIDNSVRFNLSFISFGYRNGMPKDLDYVFDVRFIPNPYYILELREKTGNDSSVYEYVMHQEETKGFLEKATPLLEYCISEHAKTGRSYLTIGVGCTGGRHRSVSICNYLSKLYSATFNVTKEHRDATK